MEETLIEYIKQIVADDIKSLNFSIYKYSRDIWNTKASVLVEISKMEDSHLMNIIRMLIRENKVTLLSVYTLLPEALKRGLWTETEKMEWRLRGVSENMWKLINH